MRIRPNLLIWASWFLYGIAWALPAFEDFPAFIAPFHLLFALSPREGDSLVNTWQDIVLTAASVVTNIVFLACPLYYLSPLARSQRKFAWIAAAAFLVNGHWYVREAIGQLYFKLGIGYFLWWWSFLLLAVGLFDLARPHEAADVSRS
jgi:hypothetical protein